MALVAVWYGGPGEQWPQWALGDCGQPTGDTVVAPGILPEIYKDETEVDRFGNGLRLTHPLVILYAYDQR
jgi:hypothetical protein